MSSMPPEQPDENHEPTVNLGGGAQPEPTVPLPPLEQSGAVPPPPPPPPGGPGWAPAAPGAIGWAQPPGYGPSTGAPYGIDPATGLPYSDKTKLVAGLLQLLVPLGIGRMYMGDVGLGIAQLLVTVLTCGVGSLWPFIDGILILVGDPKDATGRPLRPS